MSLEMIAPLLSSMSAPLSATVIKSARPWVPGHPGEKLGVGDRSKKLEVRNISKSQLETRGVGTVDAANVLAQTQQIVVSPVFKLVFLTVVALTVVSGAAAVIMAFLGDGVKPNEQAVFESMNTAWKLGLGAIFGLLGGKAA